MDDQSLEYAELDFGAACRTARQQAGWSQRELARRCGLHQSQLALLEAGRDVRLSSLQRVAGALGLTLNLEPAAPAAAAAVDDEIHWPGLDDRALTIFRWVLRIAQLLQVGNQKMAGRYGLNSGEIMVLGAMGRLPAPHAATPTELQKMFWITLPGVTKRLTRLLASGYVELDAAGADRRRRIYRLSARGAALLDWMILHPTPEFAALSDLPPSMRLRLAADLQALVRRLEPRSAATDGPCQRIPDPIALPQAPSKLDTGVPKRPDSTKPS